MKTAKNALIFFLLLLAIKDAALGLFLLFNLDWILSHAGMTYSEDVKIMASFFGVCVLIVSTLCITAISWVAGNKPNGVFLGKFIAWWMIIAAFIIYFKLRKLDWCALDFISGILILIPAYIYSGKMKTTK
jgi:hypothetical protein